MTFEEFQEAVIKLEVDSQQHKIMVEEGHQALQKRGDELAEIAKQNGWA